MSEAHDNFTKLLGKLVTVSHTELQRRMADEKATKDWTKKNGQIQRRKRLKVPPVPAASSESRSSQT